MLAIALEVSLAGPPHNQKLIFFCDEGVFWKVPTDDCLPLRPVTLLQQVGVLMLTTLKVMLADQAW